MRAGILRVVESKRVYHADLFAWADAREAKRRDDRQAATERERIRRAAARQKVAAQQDAEAGQDARPCPSLLRQLALNGVAPMLSRIAPGPQRLPNAP